MIIPALFFTLKQKRGASLVALLAEGFTKIEVLYKTVPRYRATQEA